MSNYTPRPVFDTLTEVTEQYKSIQAHPSPHECIHAWLSNCFLDAKLPIDIPPYAAQDYQWTLNFLYSYRGSTETFSAYRRDLERLLQWSWFERQQSILLHKRDDIEAFIEFCHNPHPRWIGLKNVARFKSISGEKRPNPDWRPFIGHLSKKDRQAGIDPKKEDYKLSQIALKAMFGILSSFYLYLAQEDQISLNPVALIRQKSKFVRKDATQPIIRRLSDQQWQTVIQRVKEHAEYDPHHERTVFILSCLYGMYLRISELVASDRWTPTMGDFFKDTEGNWWFKTVGKGNKARQIAVSDAMLAALIHYRTTYLHLTPYPLLAEPTPLIGHLKNPQRSITSTRPIRKLIQTCFDEAADAMAEKGHQYEADLLRAATVHWLRHTGISEDVKHRPREHVRDDAGHGSSAITDRYIDVELKERARSAKDKSIVNKYDPAQHTEEN